MLEQFLKQTEFADMEDFKNNYQLNIPDNFNFAYDVVDAMAASAPDKCAIIWTNSSGLEISMSFADMKRESDRMASWMQSLGIGRGDMVMLILKRRLEFWYVMMALHKIGAVAAPATHMLTAADITYRCNAAGIKAIFSTDDSYLIRHMEDAVPECPTVEHYICCGEDIPKGWHDLRREYINAPDFVRSANVNTNDDPMLIYFTSGTTGSPKMVVHSYTYPLGHIITAKYWHNLNENSVHTTLADTGWGKAVWGTLYGQWICGATIFVFDYDVFKPKTLLALIERFHLTSFCAPPTVYGALLREGLDGYDLSALKYCTAAGEPLPQSLFEGFYAATGLKIHEAFGQTETTATIITFSWTEPRLGAMGMANPAYDIELMGDDGQPVAVDEPGEIVIRLDRFRPAGLFTGYYKNPEMTEKALGSGIYHTGDIARRDAEGYFRFMGRNDDVIKSSGYRVGSFEVENTLITHPCIMECAVTGVKDNIRGQVIKATIVLFPEYRDKAGDKLAKEIQQYVKNKTASYKMPRIVEFVDELPKTTNGKIKRIRPSVIPTT